MFQATGFARVCGSARHVCVSLRKLLPVCLGICLLASCASPESMFGFSVSLGSWDIVPLAAEAKRSTHEPTGRPPPPIESGAPDAPPSLAAEAMHANDVSSANRAHSKVTDSLSEVRQQLARLL